MNEQDKTKSLKELEGLLELAEKASEKALSYRQEITKRNNLIIWSAVFAALILSTSISVGLTFDLLIVYQTILTVAVILFLIFATLFIQSKMKEQRELRRKLHIELDILHELLNMIDGIKDIIKSEKILSPIEKAMIEMRLKRISYSSN